MFKLLSMKVEMSVARWLFLGVGLLAFLNCGREESLSLKKRSVLRVPLYQDIQGIDPLISTDIMTSNIARQVFDGLFDHDPNIFSIVPEIVKRFRVRGDTLFLFLRRDVYFQDDACFPLNRGRKVWARDVSFSLRRKIHYEKKLKKEDILRFFDEKSIEILDSFNLRIVFHGDLKELLTSLASQSGWVIPKEAIQYYRDKFQYHPVGCGPFRLSLYDPPRIVILTKNENYYKRDETGRKLPYLDEVDFLFMSGEEQKATFRRGDVDICLVSIPLNPLSDTGVKMLETPKFNTLGLGINMRKNTILSKNRYLREAIALAIPPDTTVGRKAKGFLPPLRGWPIKENPIPYNPKRAMNLLKIGKIKRETKLELYVPVGDEGIYGERVKNYLKKIGLKVKVVPLPRSLYWQKVEKGELPFFRMGWISDRPDAPSYYSVFTSASPMNLTHYFNPEYDSIFGLLEKAKNRKEEIKYMNTLEKILRRDLPFIYWKHEVLRFTVRNYVKGIGISLNPFNKWYLEYVYLER